ncbi:MAG: DTW domain-containing protein [Gammaproteobacteria bacterium]|nr:DTW domain-containing protein [Gammaproteobacteria bacterium]MBL6998703.1 DTW domain-containing protein [Gammaproteobacteria bacterium]
MKIILLTHQRELKKSTNTGSLVVDVLADKAEVIVWHRKNPSPRLLDYIAQGSTALLYPSNESLLISQSDDYQRYIIIDGTWQEAQKIFNRSPYLHDLPGVKIQLDGASAYNLRRNQRPDCLCTAECAIEALKARGLDDYACDLQSSFISYLSPGG